MTLNARNAGLQGIKLTVMKHFFSENMYSSSFVSFVTIYAKDLSENAVNVDILNGILNEIFALGQYVEKYAVIK